MNKTTLSNLYSLKVLTITNRATWHKYQGSVIPQTTELGQNDPLTIKLKASNVLNESF